MARIRIVLEFNEKNINDTLLYKELIKYSSPPSIVKDILMGLIELPDNMRCIKGAKVYNVDNVIGESRGDSPYNVRT